MKFSVSVKEFVQTALLHGDIDSRYVGRGRNTEGTMAHQFLQKRYTDADKSEVALSLATTEDDITLMLSGRMDGLLNYETAPIIEEIKSTYRLLDEITEVYELHLAQAQVYGYIYCEQNERDEIDIRMTYFSLSEHACRSFDYHFTYAELSERFGYMKQKYFAYLRLKVELNNERNQSIESLEFPFSYRKYQKSIISRLYRVFSEEKNIFVCAPTGSGKTINALFPAFKYIKQLRDGKIFYLTAKSTQKELAESTIALLCEQGLRQRSVTITAKEKSCRLERPACNPDDCPYARGYYDKLQDICEVILKNENVITKEILEHYAEENLMCPFELSLDLAQWSDVVICDYNYVFDPAAALKRFFEEKKGEFIFLVDEAHNLVDRSRDMYSAVLSREEIVKLKKLVKGEKKLVRELKNIDKLLGAMREACGEAEQLLFDSVSSELLSALYDFQSAADAFLSAPKKNECYDAVYDMYFNIVAFMRISELAADAHVVYYDRQSDELKLFCTDAREYLSERLTAASSAVFFSATLTPLDYYCELLGGKATDYLLSVPAIFPPENFKLIVDASIKTSYTRRAEFFLPIAERIGAIYNARPANYIAFFPSYEFMNRVYDEYVKINPEADILLQRKGMREAERTEMLSELREGAQKLLFAVAGGVFSEGVDLKGEALFGAIICGVSLPLICFEREQIKNHFSVMGRDGFEYAYTIPAMNKILQSMGRVIRTDTDVGLCVLLDERFTFGDYAKCFPKQYESRAVVRGTKQLESELKSR